MRKVDLFTSLTVLTIASLGGVQCQSVYQLGVGIGDVTGPAAEIGMMGYAKLGQDTGGIHFRLYSRAFVVADDKGTRLLMINCDLGMTAQIVQLEVVKHLKERYNGLYHEGNTLISSTHTHSGPGGFLQYVLYIATTQGFIRENFYAILTGILRSVDQAHNMAEKTRGHIYFNRGNIDDANINRSPTAYVNNPPDEQKRYSANVDKEMQLLKFVREDGSPLGLITWFPVHCTSMNNTNHLISGDNKGYASYIFEKMINRDSLPGKGPFVAAFANANQGDVSPNTMGPRCEDTGLPCDALHSTCNGQVEKCFAPGPGRDMFESTQIIGYKQFDTAYKLFESASEKIEGPLGWVHQYIDMTSQQLSSGGANFTTCRPAMGFSFAAGTTDGPGAFPFSQGTSATPFWNTMRDFIKPPSQQLLACHHPKPILLPTGELKVPYDWQPDILPVQMFRIGSVLNVALPGEFTTMSGRRVRDAVLYEAFRTAQSKWKVVLSGLANAYSSYIATPEEYQVQRYEGASTIYGPYTLSAYIQQYMSLTYHLTRGLQLPPTGKQPPNLLARQISLKPPVVYDGAPAGKKFGDVLYQVQPRYSPGEQVYCAFVAGNPRNDLQLEKSYLTVERKEGNSWYIVAVDGDWETKFYWHRTNPVFGESQVTITWDIPQDIKPGVYRIRHFGAWQSIDKKITPYQGITNEFEIGQGGDEKKYAESNEATKYSQINAPTQAQAQDLPKTI